MAAQEERGAGGEDGGRRPIRRVVIGRDKADALQLTPESAHLLLASIYGAHLPISTPSHVLLEIYSASSEHRIGSRPAQLLNRTEILLFFRAIEKTDSLYYV